MSSLNMMSIRITEYTRLEEMSKKTDDYLVSTSRGLIRENSKQVKTTILEIIKYAQKAK